MLFAVSFSRDLLSMTDFASAVILWQNIIFALAVKAVFFVLTFVGNTSLWLAVFADLGASLIVVFNGMRLLRSKRGR